MIIGNSAIQHFVSKAVTHTHFDADKDAYSSVQAGASAPVAAFAGNNDTGATQSGTEQRQGYAESFAKMMVNLKAASANTAASMADDEKTTAAAAFAAASDRQMAASDSVVKSVDDVVAADEGGSKPAEIGSAKAQFMAYMNQSDAEKVRQQLTGVTKEEYDAMSPEDRAAVDKKVADLQKQKAEQQIAEQQVKTRIAMAKAELA